MSYVKEIFVFNTSFINLFDPFARIPIGFEPPAGCAPLPNSPFERRPTNQGQP